MLQNLFDKFSILLVVLRFFVKFLNLFLSIIITSAKMELSEKEQLKNQLMNFVSSQIKQQMNQVHSQIVISMKEIFLNEQIVQKKSIEIEEREEREENLKNEDLRDQLKRMKKQLREIQLKVSSIGTFLERMTKNQDIKRILQEQDTQKVKIVKLQQQKRVVQQKGIIEVKSLFFQNFEIKGDTITLKGLGSQLLGQIPIYIQPVNRFFLVKGTYFLLGIVDSKYYMDRDSTDVERKQCICYDNEADQLCISGKWMQPVKKGAIKRGEIVTMRVQGDSIVWAVGQDIRCQYSNIMISNASIKWVPFLALSEKGDQIKWY